MARFIIATFLLLGWGFYELSGGADFTPPQAEARPLNALLKEVAEEEEARTLVARGDQSPSNAQIIGQGTLREENAPVVTLAGLSTSLTETSTTLDEALGEAEAKLETEEPVETVASAIDWRVVSGTRVNMRNGPGTNHQVLDQLVQGDQAEVLQDPGNGWLKIRVAKNGSIGWMSGSLLTPLN